MHFETQGYFLTPWTAFVGRGTQQPQVVNTWDSRCLDAHIWFGDSLRVVSTQPTKHPAHHVFDDFVFSFDPAILTKPAKSACEVSTPGCIRFQPPALQRKYSTSHCTCKGSNKTPSQKSCHFIFINISKLSGRPSFQAWTKHLEQNKSSS